MSSSSQPGTPGLHDEPRSIRKRKAILEAATTLFLRNGYLGTSMDEIAALARVSKQTVYKAFSGKESLFSEIVISAVNEAADPVHASVLELRGHRRHRGGSPRVRAAVARTGDATADPAAAPSGDRRGGAVSRAGTDLLPAGPGANDRRARDRLRAPCWARGLAAGRSGARGRALQLARHVHPLEPGDVSRRG